MSAATIGPQLEAHRRYVWGLCYRMTGDAAEAEDLVQETFVRSLTRPPADLERPLRPWLTKVAVNLSRDALRRRKVRGYVGPWLPSPVSIDEAEPPSVEPPSTEGRYELMESVSFAFLVALEALAPRQRAVLLLRDVFDYSGAETAAALDMSEGNVKVVLHRARAKMSAYDADRRPPSTELTEQTRDVLGRILMAMAGQDHETLNTLVADQARELSDGGGEFLAALRPIVGRDKVIKFFMSLLQRRPPKSAEVRAINGAPGLVLTFDPGSPREAPRAVLLCDVDERGQVQRFYTVLSTDKLSAIATGA